MKIILFHQNNYVEVLMTA